MAFSQDSLVGGDYYPTFHNPLSQITGIGSDAGYFCLKKYLYDYLKEENSQSLESLANNFRRNEEELVELAKQRHSYIPFITISHLAIIYSNIHTNGQDLTHLLDHQRKILLNNNRPLGFQFTDDIMIILSLEKYKTHFKDEIKKFAFQLLSVYNYHFDQLQSNSESIKRYQKEISRYLNSEMKEDIFSFIFRLLHNQEKPLFSHIKKANKYKLSNVSNINIEFILKYFSTDNPEKYCGEEYKKIMNTASQLINFHYTRKRQLASQNQICLGTYLESDLACIQYYEEMKHKNSDISIKWATELLSSYRDLYETGIYPDPINIKDRLNILLSKPFNETTLKMLHSYLFPVHHVEPPTRVAPNLEQISDYFMKNWWSYGFIRRRMLDSLEEHRGIWVGDVKIPDKWVPTFRINSSYQQEFVHYFQFIRNETVDTDHSKWQLFLRRNQAPTQPPRLFAEEHTLTEFVATQCCQTLLEFKIAEFSLFCRQPELFKTEQSTTLPFFLLTHDCDRFHIDIMKAHIQNNCLMGLSKDYDQEAENYLREKVSSEIEILEDEETGKTAKLTEEELKQLQASFKTQTLLPHCYILERRERETANPDKVSEKKRGKTLSGSMIPTAARQAEPVIGESSAIWKGAKRKADPIQDESPDKQSPQAIAKKTRQDVSDYVKGSVYHPLEELWEDTGHGTKRMDQQNNDGQIPLYAIPSLNAPFVHPDEGDPLKQLQVWMDRDIHKVSQAVSREVAKVQAHFKQEKLYFPVLTQLGRLQPLTPLPRWFGLAKDYQHEVVEKTFQLLDQGLAPIIAFEMGLGKTFVGWEIIAEKIARRHGGLHFVIVPNSLLGETEKKLTWGMYEAKYTAWRMVVEKGLGDRGRLEYMLFSFQRGTVNKEEEAFFLRVLALFPESSIPQVDRLEKVDLNEVRARAYKAFKELIAKYPRHEEQIQLEAEKILTRYRAIFPTECAYFESLFTDTPIQMPCANTKELPCRQKLQLMQLLGALLALEPTSNTPLYADNYQEEHLYELIDLTPTDNLKRIESHKELHDKIDTRKTQIIITTYGCLKKEKPRKEYRIDSFIVDEAHRSVNEEKKTYESLKKWIQSIKQRSSKPAVVFMTGTPVTNQTKDVYNLLTLLNGEEQFPVSTLKTMEHSLKLLKERLHKEYSDELEKRYTNTFINYHSLRKVISQLVFTLGMKNESVVTAWDGKVPTPVFSDKDCTTKISEASRQAFDQIYQDFEEKNINLLKYGHQFTVLTVHPHLQESNLGTDLKHNIPALQILRAMEQDFQAVEGTSPMLSCLGELEELQEAIDKRQRIIILTQYNLVGAIVRKWLEKRFNLDKEGQIRKFDGETNHDTKKRDETIEWFKKEEGFAKVLTLSINAGGVGLDFPEATLMVDTTNKYVPSETDQAYARISRVGGEGEKKIITLYYGTYFEQHQRCITEEKKAWTELLLGKADNTDENIQTFCTVLHYSCLHKLLNTTKAIESAEEEIAKNVQPNIEKIKRSRSIPRDIERRTRGAPESISQPTPLRELVETQNLCYVYAGLHALLNSPYFHKMLGSDLQEDGLDKKEVSKALKSAVLAHTTGHEKEQHFSALRSCMVERNIHPDLVEKFRQQDVAAFIEAVLGIYPYGGQEHTYLKRGDSPPSIGPQVPFKTLQLSPSFGKNLQELLSEEFSYSIIQAKTPMHQQRRLSDLPPSLVIQLKRFTNWGVKNTEAVALNDGYLLDLTPAVENSKGKQLYQLKSFIKHLGDSPESGHYVSYLLENEQWYEYDDTAKRPIAIEKLPVKDAYVYIFDKFVPPPPPPVPQKRPLEEAPVAQLEKKTRLYEEPEQNFIVIPTPADMCLNEKKALGTLWLSENKEAKQLFHRAIQLGIAKPDIRRKIREKRLEKGELKQTLDQLFFLAKKVKYEKPPQKLYYTFDDKKRCYTTSIPPETGKPKIRLYAATRMSKEGKSYTHFDLLIRRR